MKKSMLFLTLLCVFAVSSSAIAGTVAYWRFEEGPADAMVARDGNPNGVYYPGALDSSGNDYDLSAWSGEVVPDDEWAQEYYRTAVPVATIPLTGAANTLSLQNAGGSPGMYTDPDDAALKNWKPLEWTVEAYIQSTTIASWRGAIGRDGDDIGDDVPPFRIQQSADSRIRCDFYDMSGTYHLTQTPANFIQAGQWYHVAATSDGSTLRLYVDGVEMSSTILGTSDTRLSDGSNGRDMSGEREEGKWTVFRGMYNGNHADRWAGYIDEVRISDTALPPSQFLNGNGSSYVTNPTNKEVWPTAVSPVTFSIDTFAPIGETVTDVQWFKKASAGDPNTVIVDNDTKYDIVWDQDGSSLTIYDGGAGDALLYQAEVSFSDGSSLLTDTASLKVSTGLVHRWSFSGNLQDSIGTADGTLYDPNGLASYTGGTELLLGNRDGMRPQADPNDITYVTLPSGIIPLLDNFMTIELWYTPHQIYNQWTSIFAFGEDNDPTPTVWNGGTGLLLQQQVNGVGPGFTYERNGAYRWTSPTVPTADEQLMFAMVWDGNAGIGTFYVNGVEVSSRPLPGTLSVINDVDTLIGAAYWNDIMINGSFDEMRIYDTALPSYYVYAHNEAGPDELNVTLIPQVSTPADTAVYPDLTDKDTDTAVLTVNITSLPPTTSVADVIWYKDDVPVGEDADHVITFDDTQSALTLHNVDASYAGDYSAEVVLNTSASEISNKGTLTVSTGLVHRWSFSGNLVDTVGGADGTLHDPNGLASYVGGTELLLDNDAIGPNNNSGLVTYVTLPSGIIPVLENYMTLELWYTPHRLTNNWSSIMAFGQANNPDPAVFDGGNGILMNQQVWYGPISGPAFTWESGGAYRWVDMTIPPVDEEIMLAMVWDGNSGKGRFYVDGVLIEERDLPGVLSAVNDTDNIIGNAWWNDTMINGSFNELRIYDFPFEGPWIEAHYQAGTEELVVNPCLAYPKYDIAGGGVNGDEPDCEVDMADFAALATEWLNCGRLDDVDCEL